MSVEASVLVPGETRIRDADGFVGTVVYVGPVASSKNRNQIYAGIIWDDDSRGKHDGSVICPQTNHLIRYFSCRPHQGSFLSLKKVDTGVALTATLLQSKYVDMNAPIIAPNNILPHSVTTPKGNSKPIEFLGELKIRKQQQLENMDKVSLRRLGISRPCTEKEDVEALKAYQHITEMDLAGNLLCQWDQQVLVILQKFPNLTKFSIAHNHVRDITKTNIITSPLSITFDRIQVLNLNHCYIQSFATIQWVATAMPNLESLCVANNDLSDLSNFDTITVPITTTTNSIAFSKLKQLDCTHCHFTQWENQVDKFGHLPMLETLNLDDNNISAIPSNAGSKDARIFTMLKSLQLCGTSISTWNDIEEGIHSFPSLQALRIKNTPLTEPLGPGEVRFLAIAKFPNLHVFNGSNICQIERIEAERRYVALVSRLLHHRTKTNTTTTNYNININNTAATRDKVKSKPDDDGEDDHHKNENDILKDHPRFQALRDKHKTLVVSYNLNPNDGYVLASSICNVTIQSLAPSSCTMDPVTRRLPGTLTVGRLKALCCRIYGMDYDLITLHFQTGNSTRRGQDMSLPIELDDDERTLDYYGVCDGAEVFMNEIDVSVRAHD